MNSINSDLKLNDSTVECSQSFKFIRRMLGGGMKPEKIMKQIRKKRYFESFYASSEKNVMKDIRRVKRKLFNPVKPKNRTEEIHVPKAELSDKLIRTAEAFEKIHHSLNDNEIITLSTMNELFLKREKGIFNYPCGSGKTTAALILSATYASPKNRIWLVTEKIETVGEYVRTLKKLGSNAVPWHGRPDDCHVPRKEFIGRNGKCCSNCKNSCNAVHKSKSENKWDCEYADILVTTHRHWHGALEADKIPETVKHVIIDEAPSLMEFMSIDVNKMNQLEDVFRFDLALQNDFKSDICIIDKLLSEGDCKNIPLSDLYTVTHSEKVVKYLNSNLYRNKIAHDEAEMMFAFLNFLKSEPVYGMIHYTNPREMNGKVYSFGRGNVNIGVFVPHMILDGSASLSDTHWLGFTIYECPELEQLYPNTVIYTVRGNPSKKALADSEKFGELEKMVLDVVGKNLVEKEMILFSNKDLSEEEEIEENIRGLTEKLKKLGVNLIPMKRGEHCGSNKGRKCHLNAICMSFFMPSPYYVLRTALSTGMEITSNRIWSNKFVSPAMKRNGGFRDAEIHKSYIRTIASDIYQTIMRGSIRDDSSNPYLVICMISNVELVGFFRKYFPQAEVVYPESGIINSIEAGETTGEMVKKYPDISRAVIENIVKDWNSQ